ncbi:hypothetical protein WMY93_010634 [Mugilogobius chulae]|uniref:Uncharacterized protein n=1 Tax=Mugilogobius chulae TaxID=88201 RepID=A0AAW0P7W5_9GOBI
MLWAGLTQNRLLVGFSVTDNLFHTPSTNHLHVLREHTLSSDGAHMLFLQVEEDYSHIPLLPTRTNLQGPIHQDENEYVSGNYEALPADITPEYKRTASQRKPRDGLLVWCGESPLPPSLSHTFRQFVIRSMVQQTPLSRLTPYNVEQIQNNSSPTNT